MGSRPAAAAPPKPAAPAGQVRGCNGPTADSRTAAPALLFNDPVELVAPAADGPLIAFKPQGR